jgi:hypothetical protein
MVVDGTLAPGNSIGTLNVVGNATLAGTLAVEVSNSGGGLVDLLNGTTNLTISPGSTVNFNLLAGPLDDPAYVFANYTSLAGTFSNVLNLPAGYTINYAYLGNSIALVPIPEPSSLAMLTFGAMVMCFCFASGRGDWRLASALGIQPKPRDGHPWAFFRAQGDEDLRALLGALCFGISMYTINPTPISVRPSRHSCGRARTMLTRNSR